MNSKPILSLAGLMFACPAFALNCQSTFNAGTATLTCSEPGLGNTECAWTGTLTDVDGGSGKVGGNFSIAKNAKSLAVVSESRLNGKKLKAGTILPGTCNVK